MHSVITKYWCHWSLVILAVVTVLSLIPSSQLPEVPGSDKTHHLLAYACLMLPVALRKPKNWLYIGCFFIAWSGAIELIQPYINRYGEWLDLLANTVGLVIGLVIGFSVRALKSQS